MTETIVTVRGDSTISRFWTDRGVVAWARDHWPQWSPEQVILTPMSSICLFTLMSGDRVLLEGGITYSLGSGFTSHT